MKEFRIYEKINVEIILIGPLSITFFRHPIAEIERRKLRKWILGKVRQKSYDAVFRTYPVLHKNWEYGNASAGKVLLIYILIFSSKRSAS